MTKEKMIVESKLHDALKQLMDLSAQNEALRAESYVLKKKLGAKGKCELISLGKLFRTCEKYNKSSSHTKN